MGGDTVFQRCGCVDPATGRRRDRSCPRPDEKGHGSWYFSCSVPDRLGRARRVRRGGHATREAALLARERYLVLRVVSSFTFRGGDAIMGCGAVYWVGADR